MGTFPSQFWFIAAAFVFLVSSGLVFPFMGIYLATGLVGAPLFALLATRPSYRLGGRTGGGRSPDEEDVD